MCGFVGFIERERQHANELALSMADQIRHRGPDDAGVWTNAPLCVTLAHRRLSIVDLSPAGHQPMLSASGRFTIAFNGEIYNHQELRAELESEVGSMTWRGHSDTETTLAGFEAWGIEATLKKLVGMFAFAVVDREQRTLTLARDRLGEKPLYFGWQADAFLFGSEIKALRKHPKWRGELDQNALSNYMRLSYVPAPMSIFKGINKLCAGCVATLPLGNARLDLGLEPEIKPYWSAIDARDNPALANLSEVQAKNELHRRLQQAITGQLQADVPVGAFLSGGVDSSLIVALMQAQCTLPVKTFAIGFDDARLDEAPYARAVAKHLGTDHTELYLSSDDVIGTIPTIIDIYDEPLADSSQIPTYLVSKLARQSVTVSLSGDGGDELFGGYNRYGWGESIWQRLRLLPTPLRKLASTLLLSVPARHWDCILGLVTSAGTTRNGDRALGDKLHKLALVINVADRDALYQKLISQQRESDSLVVDTHEKPSWDQIQVALSQQQQPIASFAEHAMMRDLIGYMSDDILAKLDRAAMAVSLETRTPLLDHRVVEFAVGLPMQHKLHQGQTKSLLRQVLYQYVPKELIERPKQGFSVPLDVWLRGKLKDWAYTHIEPHKLKADGLLNADLVAKRWQEHQCGDHNWQHWLWNVVMFQAWKNKWTEVDTR
jgi:asparagine synthase (glutamine-hydrolysing)